jgi:hypothetical protein
MEAPITIREAVLAIKKRDFLLPDIQRELVWKAGKMETLFDSLMRGYPVGSFLFWKVTPESSRRYKFYEFMQNFHALNNTHLTPYEINEPKTLTVVLDGQQRLTSLAIGILGYRADKLRGMWANNPNAYPQKRLYLNLAAPYQSDEEIDRAYDFRFMTEAEAAERDPEHYWFPLKQVLEFAGPQDMDMGALLAYIYANQLNEFGGQTLLKLCSVIIKDPVLHYFQEDEQTLDRVLNIFVRLNAGGIPLSYSDLLLSIATAQWKSNARQAIYGLVDELNEYGDGFEFDKDFVLKSALVLTNRPSIKFSVENFDRENTAAIEENWESSVRAPLLKAVELAASFGYHGKTLTSANVLIPVAYYLKQIGSPANFTSHPDHAEDRKRLRAWLIVGLLKGVFSSKTDTLLGAVRSTLQANLSEGFPSNALERTLATHSVSLKFSDDELDVLLDSEYGKRNAFSVLAAVYPALNTQFRFHLDHIFPKSSFKRRLLLNAGVQEEAIEFYLEVYNQLPNLQMLEGVTNQAKQDTSFEDWIHQHYSAPDAWASYSGQHLIPQLEHGYALANFQAFYEERRKLMLARLKRELPCVTPAE